MVIIMDKNHVLNEAAALFLKAQDTIMARLEGLETSFISDKPAGRFLEHLWHHEESSPQSGGGRTRVMENGRVFEKAGVNFSDVRGFFSDEMAASLPGDSRQFRASGISLVLHPANPHVPTVHANFRAIQQGPDESPERIWFGGGSDLTPYILYEEDARHFHRTWKSLCDENPALTDYRKMKKSCDEYFYLPHRQEARGAGGIFFDYLQSDPEALLEFVRKGCESFLAAYIPIVEKRIGTAVTHSEREFQLWRRGRYVEFNLMYDRGTIFGLRTGGRIESIFMSLPPLVSWQYDRQVDPGSPEDELIQILKNPRDWI